MFNIRVYGIFVFNHRLLLSKEYFQNTNITKFPGGGLKYGEGILDCLIREVKEELGQELLNPKHFYTCDFFQASAFHSNQQIISIYYTAQLPHPDQIKLNESTEETGAKIESVEWKLLERISKSEFTFPIDQEVFSMLTG